MKGHFGFTGTGNQALSREQARLLLGALQEAWDAGFTHFHHGDCVHADATAHDLAYAMGFNISIHPPSIGTKRAFKGLLDGGILADRVVILPAKPYLERNHDIVDASEHIIACPKETTEQLRSGTWATVRYARKQGKTVKMIWPEGEGKS